MKPKPLSSLNHLTVPVAMFFLHGQSAANAAVPKQRLRALAQIRAELCARPNRGTVSARVVGTPRRWHAVRRAPPARHLTKPVREGRGGRARRPRADRPDGRGGAYDGLRPRLPGLAQV